MDIQEKQFQEMYLTLGGKQVELEKENGEYTHSKSQMAWGIWQAAKVSVVPEGFVLVSKDRLTKAVDGIEALFEEDYTLALGQLLPIQQDLNAMIEAQEPTND